MKKIRYRVVNKRRFYSFVLISLFMLLTIIVLFSNYQKVYSSTYDNIYNINRYKEVIVKEGDTLWKIAIENMPPGYDVRKMVYEIKEFNEIVDRNIYPGELIKVPIKYSPNE